MRASGNEERKINKKVKCKQNRDNLTTYLWKDKSSLGGEKPRNPTNGRCNKNEG